VTNYVYWYFDRDVESYMIFFLSNILDKCRMILKLNVYESILCLNLFESHKFYVIVNVE